MDLRERKATDKRVDIASAVVMLTLAAALPAALVHPVLFAARQLASGGLLRPVGVYQEQPPSQGHHGVGIDVADRSPRRYPEQEADLRLIQVPDPDQYWISTSLPTCRKTTHDSLSNAPRNHQNGFPQDDLRVLGDMCAVGIWVQAVDRRCALVESHRAGGARGPRGPAEG